MSNSKPIDEIRLDEIDEGGIGYKEQNAIRLDTNGGGRSHKEQNLIRSDPTGGGVKLQGGNNLIRPSESESYKNNNSFVAENNQSNLPANGYINGKNVSQSAAPIIGQFWTKFGYFKNINFLFSQKSIIK